VTEQSLDRDRNLMSYSGTLLSHRRNYLLFATWMHPVNQAPSSPAYQDQPIGTHLQPTETKFQFSIKIPVLTGIFDDRTRLWAAYTQQSHWQAYNWDQSSPFRETNFEPEVFLSHEPGWQVGDGRFEVLRLGLNHESNGREQPFSRSWNRIKGEVVYSTNRWVFALSPWYRIPESTDDDDNPDIDEYIGYGDLRVLYKAEGRYAVEARFFNNLRSDNNRTSAELNLSFPLNDTLSAHFQYYNGYGETLIGYNERIQRIGLGVSLNTL
jgi:phospholipase A1